MFLQHLTSIVYKIQSLSIQQLVDKLVNNVKQYNSNKTLKNQGLTLRTDLSTPVDKSVGNLSIKKNIAKF